MDSNANSRSTHDHRGSKAMVRANETGANTMVSPTHFKTPPTIAHIEEPRTPPFLKPLVISD